MTDQPPPPEQTPVDAAIDRVLAKQVDLVQVTLIATARMLHVAANGALRFRQPADVSEPRLFILQSDGQAWQAVGLEAGLWELHAAPDDELPKVGPAIWTPPS